MGTGTQQWNRVELAFPNLACVMGPFDTLFLACTRLCPTMPGAVELCSADHTTCPFLTTTPGLGARPHRQPQLGPQLFLRKRAQVWMLWLASRPPRVSSPLYNSERRPSCGPQVPQMQQTLRPQGRPLPSQSPRIAMTTANASPLGSGPRV